MHGTDSTCMLRTSPWLKSHTKSVRPRQIIKIRKGINYKDNKPKPSVYIRDCSLSRHLAGYNFNITDNIHTEMNNGNSLSNSTAMNSTCTTYRN